MISLARTKYLTCFLSRCRYFLIFFLNMRKRYMRWRGHFRVFLTWPISLSWKMRRGTVERGIWSIEQSAPIASRTQTMVQNKLDIDPIAWCLRLSNSPGELVTRVRLQLLYMPIHRQFRRRFARRHPVELAYSHLYLPSVQQALASLHPKPSERQQRESHLRGEAKVDTRT